MDKLSDHERSLLALVLRSPDTGDGWRGVSEVLRPLVTKTVAKHPELYDFRDENGLFIRLSERGTIVRDYL